MINVTMSGISMVIFLIVLIVSWAVLPKMGLRGLSRAALAFCVALLSVLGLQNGFPLRSEEDQPSVITGLLIPYAALGISILIVLLMSLFGIGLEWIGKPGRRDPDGNRSESDTYE